MKRPTRLPDAEMKRTCPIRSRPRSESLMTMLTTPSKGNPVLAWRWLGSSKVGLSWLKTSVNAAPTANPATRAKALLPVVDQRRSE